MSDQNTQSYVEGQAVEPFQMESFESSDGAEGCNEDHYDFELYCNLGSEKEISFDYLVSSDAKCAEEIVAQSNEILSAAKNRADEIERDAYEKGFAQGQKDGYEFGGKKLDKVLGSIERILRELLTHKKRFVSENEVEILTLVRRVAERVVKGKVNVDNEIVRKTILEAFILVSDPTEVTVKVSEEDLEYVRELRPVFFEQIEGMDTLTMEADPTVARGGCLLEARSGNVDARLETQLEMIMSAIERTHALGGGNEGDTQG